MSKPDNKPAPTVVSIIGLISIGYSHEMKAETFCRPDSSDVTGECGQRARVCAKDAAQTIGGTSGARGFNVKILFLGMSVDPSHGSAQKTWQKNGF